MSTFVVDERALAEPLPSCAHRRLPTAYRHNRFAVDDDIEGVCLAALFDHDSPLRDPLFARERRHPTKVISRQVTEQIRCCEIHPASLSADISSCTRYDGDGRAATRCDGATGVGFGHFLRAEVEG